MGFCKRCIYNSVDQLLLGWSRVSQLINWETFQGSTTVTIPALSDNRLGVVQIRLALPVEPGVPNGVTRNLYLSYRVKKNQDIDMPDKYNLATSVHAENGNSWILAWPKTGQAYVNTANQMVVRQDFGNTNEAHVTICKWVVTETECGSFGVYAKSFKDDVSTGPVDRDAYYGKCTHQHVWGLEDKTDSLTSSSALMVEAATSKASHAVGHTLGSPSEAA